MIGGARRAIGGAARRRWRTSDRLSMWNWRSAVVTAALLGTVVVSAAGAWAVRDSWLEHQRAVEVALDEYAAYAARTFAGDLSALNLQLRVRSLAPVLGAAAQPEWRPPTLAGVAAVARAALDREAGFDVDPWRGFFRVDLETGGYEALERAAEPAAAAALRGLVASQRPALDTARIPLFSLVEIGGDLVSVIYMPTGRPAAGPTAVYGYTIAWQPSLKVLADSVVRRTLLLPPSILDRGRQPGRLARADTLISLRLVHPDGRVVYESPSQFASTASGQYRATLTGVAVHAVLHPGLVEQLRAELLNDDRRRLRFALPILSLLLAAATILHLRRERELVRARRDFVASVSHELRTPLAQIRMFSETLLLGREESEEERLRWTAVIGREARRLGDLVENILLFSHIDAARVRLEPERTDLGELVEEAVEAYVPVAASRRMRIVADAPSRIYALVDPRALRQVVVNLLDNALKYGPRGQTVSVEVVREDAWARLVVSDEGPGVAPADRARLWRPFVRLDESGGSAGGSGIGLSVVRSLVTQHGGTVAVEDAPGGGARFVVALPLADGAPPPRRVTSEHAVAARG